MIDLYHIKTLTENAHVLEWGDGTQAIWTRVKLRKECKCTRCWGEIMEKGTEAFRPLGNQQYRFSRLCVACVTSVVVAKRGDGGEQS